MRSSIPALLLAPLLLLAAGCTDELVTAPQEVLFSTSGETTSYEAIFLKGGAGNAYAINDAGIAVGAAGDGISGYPAVRWVVGSTGVGEPEKLGILPFPVDDAHIQIPSGINSEGIVVGTAISNKYIAAWVYGDNTGMQLLPRFVGDTYQFGAHGINDLGIVVGFIDFAVRDSDGTITDRLRRGAVWLNTDDEPILLPPLEGHDVSSAGTINNVGLVTGSSASGAEWVFVTWRINAAGEVTDGPHQLEAGFRPTAVNDAGDIAGYQVKPGASGAALMRAGHVLSLPPLGTRDGSSFAHGIGEAGANGVVRIVGRSGSKAVVWTIDANDAVSVPMELRLPSGNLDAVATAVNAQGVIVGSGTPKNGGSSPILWRPVQDDGGQGCKGGPKKCG